MTKDKSIFQRLELEKKRKRPGIGVPQYITFDPARNGDIDDYIYGQLVQQPEK